MRIQRAFIEQIMQLFESESTSERWALQKLVHLMYAKLQQSHRTWILQSIRNVLTSFAFESRQHIGVAELLYVLHSFIEGFNVPLKLEHKVSACCYPSLLDACMQK